MIYIRERKDVEDYLETLDCRIIDFKDGLDDALYELEDYADNSIYEDHSKGGYEDNQSFVESTKLDLIKDLEDLKKWIDSEIESIKKIEPER